MAADINYVAVLVVAVVNMVLGSLWYGPLFGKTWIRLMNFDPAKVAEGQAKGMKGMWKSYLLAFIGALVMGCVLARVIGGLGVVGALAGAKVGFSLWLGIVAPVTLGMVIWEGKSWKLWLILNAYYFIVLKLMGAILASWV